MLTKFHTLALAIAAGLATVSLPAHAQKAPPIENGNSDPVVQVSAQDAQMNAAIADAQTTLALFLEALAEPPEGAHSFSFKFPLGGYEHIWVRDVRLEGNRLLGTLSNRPFQEGWRLGDPVAVPLSQVSDWSYVDAQGYTHGGYTIRVLLDYLPPAEAAQVRAAYGW